MFENLIPLELNEWKGDFDRASFNDNVPPSHFVESLNIDFEHFSIKNRDFFAPVAGITSRITSKQAFQYVKTDNTIAYMVSADPGGGVGSSLYLNSGATLIFGPLVGWDGTFTAVQIDKYIFFSPNKTGSGVWIIDLSVPSSRAAAGSPPGSNVTAATSATAGNVEIGVHLISVAYETSTGFITQPRLPPVQYTAPGAKKIDLSNIPTGPSGTTARHIVVTKTIANYSGNPNDYEFFKVARIADNTSTTLTIDFFDQDLVDSADNLFDLLTVIPCCRVLLKYGNRLVCIADESNANVVRISNPGEYESFDSVDGYILNKPPVPNGFQGGIELNGLLYLISGSNVLSTNDNGDFPNTWALNEVDGSHDFPFVTTALGHKKFLATIKNTPNSIDNAALVAAETGLLVFRGGLQDNLTWKIEDKWKKIYPNIKDIIVSITAQQIYILFTDSGVDYIRVGDFKEGLSKDSIRWTTWTLTGVSQLLNLFLHKIATEPYAKLASIDAANTLMAVDSSLTADKNDLGITVTPTISFTAFLGGIKENFVNLYTYCLVRAKGTATIQLNLRGLDDDFTGGVVAKNIALSAIPGKEYITAFNYMNEKVFIVLVNTTTGTLGIKNITLYGLPVFTRAL